MPSRFEVVDTRIRHGEGELFKRLPGAQSVEVVVIKNSGDVSVETRGYEGPFSDSNVPSGRMLFTYGEKFPFKHDAQSSAMELTGRIKTKFPGISVVVKNDSALMETATQGK
jgi:hypothetical protein